MHPCPVAREDVALLRATTRARSSSLSSIPSTDVRGQGVHSMRVMQIGLGPIGCAVSRLLVKKSGWHIVAAMDADPAKQGRDLGEIVGLERQLGVTVTSDLAAIQSSDVDLAFLTTVSTFP